jgi:hypothetical protein
MEPDPRGRLSGRRRRTGRLVPCAALAVRLTVGSAAAGSLAGWTSPAMNPEAYTTRVVDDEHHAGRSSALVECAGDRCEGPATLMQTVSADAYRGRRVRLAGYLKTRDVEGWAGLWMRVDGARRLSLAFDNMSRRSVSGTTPWTRYEVVLDVPEEAVRIAFGVLLAGPGRVFADELSLGAVGPEVASTDLGYPPEYATVDVDERLPERPGNLSFEE